jgi:hypothetical protein
MAGDGLVVSADKKVIKIWNRNSVRSSSGCIFLLAVLWTMRSAIRKFHLVDPGSGPE